MNTRKNLQTISIEEPEELIRRGGGQITFDYEPPSGGRWSTSGVVTVGANRQLQYVDDETGACISPWPAPGFTYTNVRLLGELVSIAGAEMRRGAQQLFDAAADEFRAGAQGFHSAAANSIDAYASSAANGTYQLQSAAAASIGSLAAATANSTTQMHDEATNSIRRGVHALQQTASDSIQRTASDVATTAATVITAGARNVHNATTSAIVTTVETAVEQLRQRAERITAEQAARERAFQQARDDAFQEHEERREALAAEQARTKRIHDARSTQLAAAERDLEDQRREIDAIRTRVRDETAKNRTEMEAELRTRELLQRDAERRLATEKRAVEDSHNELQQREAEIQNRLRRMQDQEADLDKRLATQRAEVERERRETEKWLAEETAQLKTQRNDLLDLQRQHAQQRQEQDRRESALAAREAKLAQHEAVLRRREQEFAANNVPLPESDSEGHGRRPPLRGPSVPFRQAPGGPPLTAAAPATPQQPNPAVQAVPRANPQPQPQHPMPVQAEMPADDVEDVVGYVAAAEIRTKLTTTAALEAFRPDVEGAETFSDVRKWDEYIAANGERALLDGLVRTFGITMIPRNQFQRRDFDNFKTLERLVRGSSAHGGFDSSPLHKNMARTAVGNLMMGLAARKGVDTTALRKLLAPTHEDPMEVLFAAAGQRKRTDKKDGKNNGKQPDAAKVTCHACGEKGHFKKNCPNPNSKGGKA